MEEYPIIPETVETADYTEMLQQIVDLNTLIQADLSYMLHLFYIFIVVSAVILILVLMHKTLKIFY